MRPPRPPLATPSSLVVWFSKEARTARAARAPPLAGGAAHTVQLSQRFSTAYRYDMLTKFSSGSTVTAYAYTKFRYI